MYQMSLGRRRLMPELMDQPGLDLDEHLRALGGLRRLNIASGSSRRLWRQIASSTGVRPGDRLRVLDVASGGGDIALGLWRQARKAGVEIQLLGLDRSPTACSHATRRCIAAGRAITFQCADATSDALPNGFDVVTCSLFLHHLKSEQAVQLLRKMSAAAPLLVVSDLRRCTAGYLVAQAACRTLTRSRVVRYDGPQSVANAFSIPEVRELCQAAGLHGAMVRPAWPWRMLITWRQDGGASPHG